MFARVLARCARFMIMLRGDNLSGARRPFAGQRAFPRAWTRIIRVKTRDVTALNLLRARRGVNKRASRDAIDR